MKSLPIESAVHTFVKNGNVVLQTRLFEPRVQNGIHKLMVVSHPYGRFGGSWSEIATSLVSQFAFCKGWYVAQYQSRGVPESSGSGSFTGISEAEDFQAVVQYYYDYLNRSLATSSSVCELLLAGCSAGSLSASIFPARQFMEQHSGVKLRFLLVSYPLTPLPLLTLYKSGKFREGLIENVKQVKSDVFVVHGDSDQFTGNSAYANWTDSLKQNDATVASIPGADHFWSTESDQKQLMENLEHWL